RETVKEVIWLRGLLEELGVELNTVAVLEAKIVQVLKVNIEHNDADALTKVVGFDSNRKYVWFNRSWARSETCGFCLEVELDRRRVGFVRIRARSETRRFRPKESSIGDAWVSSGGVNSISGISFGGSVSTGGFCLDRRFV
ncbi:hypothetical protein Tco_1436363, partial [Tanacetum coccineum]